MKFKERKKKVTIVTKFKNQLKDIADLTSCRIVGLNASKPKYNPSARESSTGVKSDHIRIFYTHDTQSFAFAFNYIKTPENPLISVSTKENGKITSSDFRESEFRERINVFVFVLKKAKESGEMSNDFVQQVFFDIFLKDSNTEQRFKEEIDSAERLFSQGIVGFMAKESKYNLRRKKVQTALETYTTEIDSQIKDLKDKIGFEEIEKQYKKAVAQIKNTQDKLESKWNIEELKKERNELDERLMENGFEKRGFFQSNLDKLPPSVSKVMVQKFQKEIKGK